ncbi:MAG: TIGR02757 family protein [Synergistaceae bacterium]|nr:TIGR02757 family protein [Synergistaceae bacterium]
MGVLSDRSALIESRSVFEKIYEDYNKRIYVSPDPLQFLYSYENPADREIVALIASSLAYGRVAQILKNVRKVLDVLGPEPSKYLVDADRGDIECGLGCFVHRFTGAADMAGFLCCIKRALYEYGSLEELFLSYYKGNTWDAVEGFASKLTECGGYTDSIFLLPRPSNGSACKRLALFLRWMVRCDEVDPGGWRNITPDALFIPLDTHMFNICSTLGLCSRKSANGRAAAEITDAFRVICPEDPVRYDFALTRFGIRSDMTVKDLFANWQKQPY